MPTREEIAAAYQTIQDEICAGLELADGLGKFEQEIWEREGGGGGRTRILQHGAIIEKGGVNFSAVYGKLPEPIKKAFGVSEEDFFATGISIVIHPNHPWVPIIHMNIRYFELSDEVRWFGGGIDLTPHYIISEDAQFFHQGLKNVCDSFNKTFYQEFKTWADNYFYIKHREETRGIGGIFYDRLSATSDSHFQEILDFSLALGRLFPEVYTHLMHKNGQLPFGKEEKAWQGLRRGRYVEFNLVWDAGTKFGLDTNGRTESILMSMPPQAEWTYQHQPQAGSPEQFTLDHLKKGIDWLTYTP